jgi:thiamine kinase-like enzyme
MTIATLTPANLEEIGWAGRRVSALDPLPGGITNRNYRVRVDDEAFVVRMPAETGHLLGIDREVEYQASCLAAQAGVGPDVIAFVRPQGMLITRFIEGEPVSEQAVHRPDMLKRVAAALQRTHGAGVVEAVFSPFRVVEVYAQTATQAGVRIPAAFGRCQVRSREIEAAFGAPPRCLCHNDLLNANFIDDGRSIRIVDWEYAGMGDRFFDLANFAVNHQLTEDEERVLLEAYFDRPTPSSHARLRLMRIMSDFREAMWGVVQQGISSLDVDFGAYAARHFDRSLRAAADPRYPRWLLEGAR